MAARETQEKEKAYTTISQIIKKNKSKGPVILMGDMNVRIQKNATEQKENI